jgi:hypothetical protein
VIKRPYHLTQAECDRLKQLRQVHSIKTCAALLKRSSSAIERAIARGFVAYEHHALRDRPADFALIAETMTIADLAKHYHTGQETVRRWASEIGRKHKWAGRPRLKPCPPDFRETYAQLGHDRRAAERHYGVCETVITRWRQQSGLPVAHKRKTLARRASKFGWVERYAAERRAQSRSSKESNHV